jgi:hypothetical protein
VRSFAEINGIPVLHLNTPDRSRWDDRKVDHVREYVNKATAPGVVAIVVAQEVQKVFMGYRRRPKQDGPQFGFDKADRRVTVYYFYCAARRLVVSPAQPGGTRREVPGSNG